MSDNFSLIIKNGNCYIQGKFQKIDLGLSGNKISKIGKLDNSNTKSIDAEGKIVLPGVIDTQVHFREPGANNAENLESGSRAAVAGGVTSVVAIPNTQPVIDEVSVLEFIARRAREVKLIKVFAHATVTKGGNSDELVEMGLLKEAGAISFTDGLRTVTNAKVLLRALKYAQA